jgi:hypothetical protein
VDPSFWTCGGASPFGVAEFVCEEIGVLFGTPMMLFTDRNEIAGDEGCIVVATSIRCTCNLGAGDLRADLRANFAVCFGVEVSTGAEVGENKFADA